MSTKQTLMPIKAALETKADKADVEAYNQIWKSRYRGRYVK